MREILFRGKRIYKNEWVYGNLVVDNRGELHIVRPEDVVQDGHHIHDDSDLPMFFEQETFGQYTGLKDKNGQRIFEGDILDGCGFDEEDGYGVVEWYDGAFEVSNKDWCGTFHENYNGFSFEVIGNIHDNPELVEGGDNDG